MLRQWIVEGRVAADSLVWREGWPQWLPAGTVFAELSAQPNPYQAVSAAAVAAVPPVVFPASEATVSGDVFPQEPRRVSRARGYGRRSQSTRTAIMVILILAVLILAPLLGYVLVQQF